MKLAIIGASRGIGRKVVDEALERGHSVRAMARHMTTVGIEAEGFTALDGDATNFEARSAVAEFIDFELLDGRAVQIRQVGTAVCVILSKQVDAPKQ